MIVEALPTSPETGHVPFPQICLADIRPSPENDRLYRRAKGSDPDMRALVKSVRKHGIKEPLVITLDGYILSGHRRYLAARLAGLRTVPGRRENFRRADLPTDEYLVVLREYNRQRTKSLDEALREEIVTADPKVALAALREHRERAAVVPAEFIALRENRQRQKLTATKKPFLDAALAVIERLRDYLPLSLRQVHYQLLNDPPLIHSGKPGSRYGNRLKCYKALSVLLTQARHEGSVPYTYIHDPTRPVTLTNCHRDAQAFMRQEVEWMFSGYERDLQQSQPNHLEILGEKNTVESILKPVAREYCIPLTIMRGYCSTPVKHEIFQRFRASGRAGLILLVLSDFDADGEEILQDMARSLRDDFGVLGVRVVKVALTHTQVSELALPPSYEKAKPGSANYQRFVEKFGPSVYELEAVPPAELQRLLREGIESVLDRPAFDAEVEKESEDAAFLSTQRQRALAAMGELQP